MHATAAAERGIVNPCGPGKVRLESQGEDMKLLRAISAMLSAAILSLARSMDISHLYSRPIPRFTADANDGPTTEHSPRIL